MGVASGSVKSEHRGGNGSTGARRAISHQKSKPARQGRNYQILHGTPYWWNPSTQESRWTDPHGRTKPEVASGPVRENHPEKDDWVVMNDPGSGRQYYFNRTNNESQWSKPEGMLSRVERANGRDQVSASNTTSSSSTSDANSASIISELRAQILAEKDAHTASRVEFRML